MNKLKLSTKLYLVGGILVAVAIVVGVLGINGVHKTNDGLETVYNDRVVPLKQLKGIADDYAVLIIDAANKCNAGIFTAEETLKGLTEAKARIDENWKAYLATTLTPEEAKLTEEAKALFVSANAAVADLQKFLSGKSGSLKGQLGNFDGPLYQDIDPISSKITELVDLQLRVAKEEYTAAHDRFQRVLWLSILSLTLGVSLGGAFGWRVISQAVRTIQHVTERLTDGAAQTTLASREVSNASNALADGASEQAASLEETSASLEEIASMTKRNAENAVNGAAVGRQTCEAAAVGLDRISELSRTLESIKSAVAEMQSAVTQMQSSSQQVTKIVKTIDEIAFQTNLLALNAAVEAARAGEAGMGFAVVANEVRALAQRSAQAAKDTTSRIEEAVRRSEVGGAATAKVVDSLAEVEATAQGIQQVFSGIVAQVKSLDELLAEIAAASKEQSQGVSEVNAAVSQMDKVTQSNAAAAEENASASQELNHQAQNLAADIRRLQALSDGAGAVAAAQPVVETPGIAPQPKQRSTKPSVKRTAVAATATRLASTSPAFEDRDIPMPEPIGGNTSSGAFKDF